MGSLLAASTFISAGGSSRCVGTARALSRDLVDLCCARAAWSSSFWINLWWEELSPCHPPSGKCTDDHGIVKVQIIGCFGLGYHSCWGQGTALFSPLQKWMAPNLLPTRAEDVGKMYLKETVVERQSFGLGFALVLTEDREGVTEEKLEGATTNMLPSENSTCGLLFVLSHSMQQQWNKLSVVCALEVYSLFLFNWLLSIWRF